MENKHEEPRTCCAAMGCNSPPVTMRAVMCATHWALVPPMTKGQLGMKARALRRGDARAGKGYLRELEEAIKEVRGWEKRAGERSRAR
jgi:hypothetical protein